MSLLQLHHTAFSSGVISSAFWGRSEIDQFDRALAEAINFYVDYRGGVKNRPGTRFIANYGTPTARLHTFALGNYTDDFLLVFTTGEMRMYVRGEQVLTGGLPLATPWGGSQLDELRFSQKDLVLTVTHPDTAPREITYNPIGGTWTLTTPDFSLPRPRPTIDSITSTAVGTANFVVAVTAVDRDGNESLPSRPYSVKNAVDFTINAGAVRYRANKVAGARSYRWYRSIVASTGEVAIAQGLGFIGESAGRTFTDRNVIPDFSRPPPVSLNPFAGGQVLGLVVNNEGSGYVNANTVVLNKTSGPGTGLVAYPSAVDGNIESILVQSWGQGYDGTSTFSITGGGGTGATVSIEGVSPNTSYPKLSAYFQQRRIFASTNNLPTGIWGSRVGDYSDFSFRVPPRDDESYHIYADIPGNDYISHLMPVNDSILIFHGYGIDRLRGGQGVAITPNSHIIERQSSVGAGSVQPILVGNAAVYSSPRGEALHTLIFNQNAGGFIPNDLTTFVKHLFTPQQKPIQLVWQPEPDRLLWVLMNNGRMLSLTFVPEQEVYAWTEHETNGHVLDMVCVRQQDRDVVYLFVQRWVNGSTQYFLEELADRRVNHVEDSWFLDAALATPITPAIVPMQIKFKYDNIGEVLSTFEIETFAPLFSSANIGDHVRTMSGLYKITDVQSATKASGVIIDYPGLDTRYSEDGWYYRSIYEWWFDKPVTSFSGMSHLANTIVSALADGNVYHGIAVNGSGAFTLPQPHSRVVVGLPYDSHIKSLPLTSREALIEGKKKRVVGLHIRMRRSRGLEAGNERNIYAMRDTSFHEREENLQLRDGVHEIKINDSWRVDNHVLIHQHNPLPAEILSVIMDVEA